MSVHGRSDERSKRPGAGLASMVAPVPKADTPGVKDRPPEMPLSPPVQGKRYLDRRLLRRSAIDARASVLRRRTATCWRVWSRHCRWLGERRRSWVVAPGFGRVAADL